MALEDIYYSLEDKYYDFMDGLEKQGTKVYEYFVDPIEARGIPSFPVFSVLSLLVLGALLFGAYSLVGGSIVGLQTGDTATVSVSVLAEGSSLEGVLVKLSYGDNVLLEKTADGVAVFTGIPKRTRVLLSVEQEGYSPFFRNTTTTSAANQELNLELEKKGKQEQFFLFVTDDNGNPLPGVTVYSKNPDGLIVELETDAQGKVPVPYNSPADSFNMRLRYEGYKEQTHTCFAGKGACEVSLSSDAPDPQIPDAPKASVSVEVLDQKGDPVVDARVSLGQEATGASLDGDYTDGIGKVFFPDAAAIGTSVYVVVEPLEGFETYTSDPKPAGETTDFLVLLKAKPKTGQTPDFSSIQIEVVGADKLPIEGAEVSLFFAEKPLKQITSAATDSGGMVLFEASATASVYATAYAPGYLPARTRVMKGGEATQLKLIKAVIGNYGSLKVNVINQEEVPVEMASVTIVSSDGYFLGLPRQETAADGSAAFTGLPVDATVKAIASYEADSGASDLVSITVEEKEVNVKLKPADAYVSVLAKQAGTSSALEATFTAYKFSDNSVIASCSGSKVACTLTVPAKTKLYLKAESKGFITATSEEFDVPAAQNLKKEVVLLDSSLSDELKVLDVRVVDFYGKNVSSVDKGRTYKFLLSVNLPSKAEKAGAFMLIGKGSSASDEPAVFTDYSKPSTATILKGSAYTPGQACADGMSDQGKELKWIDYSFTDFGSKTISSTVFVTPKATAQDELVLQYRLSAKKASSFLRLPEDKAFGSKEKTDDLDWCYAKTMELRIPVKEGGTTCSDSACLSALFRLNSSTSANGMMIPLNSEFTVEINLRAFSSLDSPFLKIDVDKSLEIKGYDFGSAVSASGNSLTIPLSFAGETTGSVTLKAGIPTQNAKIAFNFGDASGTLLEAQRYVVVQGTGVLSVSADPLELTANQGNSIKVTILSKEGKSIDDAKIIFKETKGAPFNGFPSGALSMLGDGTEEHGKDGSYLLSGISPTSVGAADLVVQRNGFSDVKKEITITTADALSFDQDPSLVEMSCTSRNTLSVTTPLTTKLNVRGSFSGSCASVRALGTAVSRDSGSTNLSSSASSTLSFQVKPGKDTKLLLTPTSLEGQCVMTLTSTTPAGLFASTQDVWLASSCAAPAAAPGASATPAASPTPVGPPLAAFCQPPSLAQILPKHYLSQGMNDQQGAYTALTAPVVLISDTNGLQFINNNEDECNLEGNKLSCTKKIYSLIPFNAMAFSVVNKVLTTTDIYFDKPGASCYRIEEVRSGLTNRILGGELSNQVSSLAGLVRNQYRTYVIYFTPKKECIQYAEKEGGGLKLSVKDNKAFNLRFWSKGFGGAQSQAYLTFKVNPVPDHPSDKYAFMLMPTSGEITLRGAEGLYEEPAILVNNIHAEKEFVASVYGKSFGAPALKDAVAKVHSGQAIAATLILNSKELKIDAKASGLGATDVVLSSSATVKHVAAPEGL
ncbi:carboxypeptidase regulatory-like domain-containing protein, partial [Candidatus Micrarchaeota archaeon]|nr:carboxypeptidase regulatory-like domain-containing protein [Candidatus Micrarchaeota archaeon]